MPARRSALRWAAGASAAYAALAALFLAHVDWNPEWFVHFGRASTVLQHGRDVLGPDLLVPHDDGQDGQIFWLMARDPLLLHPGDALRFEDRPAYRSQRVLYPALAAPARLAGERALVWGLLAVNVAVVGLGAFWTSLLCREVGAPQRATLAFVLNPAVAVAVLMDSGDALAVAMLVGGLVAWTRRRWALAALAFALAVLAKEVTLLVPVVLALATVRRAPARAAGVLLIPVAAAVAWGVYARARLGWPSTRVDEVTAPLRGFGDAWRRGWSPLHDWANAAVAVALLVVAAAVVALWLARRGDVVVAALPFALLYPLLSAQVLDLAVNSVRSMAPALTFAVVGAYAPVRRT